MPAACTERLSRDFSLIHGLLKQDAEKSCGTDGRIFPAACMPLVNFSVFHGVAADW
jgi:hypothetical protein